MKNSEKRFDDALITKPELLRAFSVWSYLNVMPVVVHQGGNGV